MKKLKAGIMVGLIAAQSALCFAADCVLPFTGRWFVMQGGDTVNVNDHMSVQGQWYGLDFVKVGGVGQRALFRTTGATTEDFFSWGASVLSPVSGVVEAVVADLPDNPVGKKDTTHPAGNHIVIRAGPDTYVFLAHFQKDTIRVKVGTSVSQGQEIGKCGNSGNSDYPHIHMHVQDTATLNKGRGQNVVFRGINVCLSGKEFSNVDWPLIRGLFVQPTKDAEPTSAGDVLKAAPEK